MNKKRIAIFLPSLNGGGAERVMVTLANAIAARGVMVDMVAAAACGPYLKELSPAVRLVDLKAGRVVSALLPLARYLRRERPVAMLSAMSHANTVALVARRIAGVSTRLVVSERGTISGEYKLAKGIIPKLMYKLLPITYRMADGICTVSEGASLDLAKFTSIPAQRINTIYNPFDLEFIEGKALQPLVHPWFSAGQPPVIVAIGRLNEAKDFPVLIRAFSRLRESHTARLLILGEGEMRPSLEEQVAECGLSQDELQMPGFVDNPYAYLARCALFVLSSRREGLPGSLIEAMACGTPVISTDCPSGPVEILEKGRWGPLVSVGDEQGLAEAMAAMLDTPRDQLPDVRQRAKDFDQERAVEAYLNILRVQCQ